MCVGGGGGVEVERGRVTRPTVSSLNEKEIRVECWRGFSEWKECEARMGWRSVENCLGLLCSSSLPLRLAPDIAFCEEKASAASISP